jgi:hypothetical protein
MRTLLEIGADALRVQKLGDLYFAAPQYRLTVAQ